MVGLIQPAPPLGLPSGSPGCCSILQLTGGGGTPDAFCPRSAVLRLLPAHRIVRSSCDEMAQLRIRRVHSFCVTDSTRLDSTRLDSLALDSTHSTRLKFGPSARCHVFGHRSKQRRHTADCAWRRIPAQIMYVIIIHSSQPLTINPEHYSFL